MTTTTAPAQTVKCKGCHRPLTATKSVLQGRGPVCHARYLARIAAAAKAEKAAQLAKAVELVEDGGLVRAAGALYLAVSTDGATRYEVTPVTGQCSCKAGQNGRRCYHLIAAELESGQRAARPTEVAPAVKLVTPSDPFATIPGAYAA